MLRVDIFIDELSIALSAILMLNLIFTLAYCNEALAYTLFEMHAMLALGLYASIDAEESYESSLASFMLPHLLFHSSNKTKPAGRTGCRYRNGCRREHTLI